MKIVVDCETGGLDPVKHSLFTAAFVHVPSFDTFSLTVREPILIATPEALKINGLDLGAIATVGQPPNACLVELHKWLQKVAKLREGMADKDAVRVTPVGHNVGFDRSFLRRLYAMGCPREKPITDQLALFEGIWSYRILDTCSTARFLKEAGVLPGLKRAGLDALIKYFHIKMEHARHSALGDALATAEVYCKLVEAVGGSVHLGDQSCDSSPVPCLTSESSTPHIEDSTST
jgi:DNA polymerase III epsilon subunit-like protein